LPCFLRQEIKFSGLDDLLACIKNDIAVAEYLDEESSFHKLESRRAAIKSVDDCLDPLYRLSERRVKLSEFLLAAFGDSFMKRYNGIHPAAEKSAVWCSLSFES
jgi:hypothetical protein